MTYYLRFNHNSADVFALLSFDETVNKTGRHLSAGLKVADVSEGDIAIENLSKFLENDSISIIEVLNEQEVVIYSSARYTKAEAFSISLNTNRDINSEEESPEIIHTLNFTFEKEAE